MSLIPSAVQGAKNDNYFPLADDGVMRAPSILPSEDGNGATAATLTMSNGLLASTGNDMRIVMYVPTISGGGLVPGQVQMYMYGTPVGGGDEIGELFAGVGLGNGYCSLNAIRGIPSMDPTRMGKITGTGAAQTIACPSITAASQVKLAFVAGTAAAADVVPVIVANTNFTLTLPAGAVYNYEVIG